MNPGTMLELQRQLQRIRSYEASTASGSVRLFSAWAGWILAVIVIAIWIPSTSDGSRFVVPAVCVLIAVRSVYSIIQYNMNKRMRPILEALLYVPQSEPKQDQAEIPISPKPKRSRTRPR